MAGLTQEQGTQKGKAKRKPAATKVAPKSPAEHPIAEICEMVAEGQTLRQIAAHYGVTSGAIMRWVGLTPESRNQYARAREAAADLFEAEIIEAAMAASPESAPADRVKIDALKWVAARRAPKKYGDRQSLEMTGANGGPIVTRDVSDLTDAQLAALIADDDKG
jgi:hypothetical protein